MISSDLLRCKLDNKSYKIYPILCSLEQNSKDIEQPKCHTVFEFSYQNSGIKEKLNQSLKGLEQTYKDYASIRGLAAVLEKRCTFRSISLVNSKDPIIAIQNSQLKFSKILCDGY
ncbi:MAG: DUF790 family protein [Candidatus Nitrosocosmicus sp.]|nr:DUF790 family protein [Candidatus Nitrosocosmicus sp.]